MPKRMTNCLIQIAVALIAFQGALFAQDRKVVVSGIIKEGKNKTVLPFVNVTLKHTKDSSLAAGTITGEDGRFSLSAISSGNYFLETTYLGYEVKQLPVQVGSLSAFLDLGSIELKENARTLNEVEVTAQQAGIDTKMDKKIFSLENNMSQQGGSVLQAMKNLPGITTSQDGKVQLRGSDRVTILIDGKQTALTGFGNQSGLDNIPASAIERIEIINNPSARYDANGNAGIINIIYKKNKQEGFNGKIGLTTGLGALWQKEENLPGIRPQYQATPKINPSLSLNYRKNKINAFFQGDWLYMKTLNKSEFAERIYDNGDTVRQQVKRNRRTYDGSVKTGVDWNIDDRNTLTVSGLYSRERVLDDGDIPYFNGKLTERRRLWQFHEDEVNSAFTAMAAYQHKFRQPGHLLNINFNYTFHREDEKYFLTDNRTTYIGKDTFMLIADEHVADLNVDYVRPLRHGRVESGLKLRRRVIPTNMRFFPGEQSPLDKGAAGWADYAETIPAIYGNYVYENNRIEAEAGIRMEYVRLNYTVNPDHNTYKSDGYNYVQPFPNVRLAYKLNDANKISFFYNRRVDRPDEGDIRIFPKYDEPEMLKVGNPALRPQFTNTFELGYKTSWRTGSFYSALYHRMTDGTITRIGTLAPGSDIIYNIYQNAGRSYNSGIEAVLNKEVTAWFSLNANVNVYRNIIDAFTVENKYPVPTFYTAAKQQLTSGNAKLNGLFHLPAKTELQVTGIYLAKDIIPQGEIGSRFSVDLGAKKLIQQGKGELFVNASDIFNTLRIKRQVRGDGFSVVSTDNYETQVFRLGYSYKF
ncbi:TonB-dependent receptor domain-containing protein [Chitinophaga flava]|nr:TonB-dependent receptor [Chitinophaga flava]